MWYIFRALALVLPYVFWRHLLHVQRSSNLLYNCMLFVVCANTHYRFQGRHTEHNIWTLSNVWEGPSLEIKRIFLNLVESIDFHSLCKICIEKCPTEMFTWTLVYIDEEYKDQMICQYDVDPFNTTKVSNALSEHIGHRYNRARTNDFNFNYTNFDK